VLALTFNAFVWGVSWWPFRHLQSLGLHPLWATVVVHLLAVTAILALRPRAFGQVLRTPALWIVSFAAGVTNAAFNWGVVAGDVVRVVLLFYLMPLWSVLLARLLLHESLTASGGLRVLLALAGAFIVLKPDVGGGFPLPHSLPDWLGIVGGMSFALNNVMLRREAAQPHESRALAMFMGGALVSATLASVLALQGAGPWLPPPGTAWITGTLLLAVCFLASNTALQFGASRLPASVTSVVMLTEVVFASLSALWLGGGTLTPSLVLGGVFIVGAALLSAFERARAP
jgi:drug/metabolite transporter (DMT)-like permease